MRGRVHQLYLYIKKQKNNEVICFLALNIMFTEDSKVIVLNFFDDENMVFLSQKVDEIWCLLITEKILFLSFWEWEIRSFFSQKIHRKMILTWPFWAFSMIFQDLENMVFPAVFPLISEFDVKRISSFLARFLER